MPTPHAADRWRGQARRGEIYFQPITHSHLTFSQLQIAAASALGNIAESLLQQSESGQVAELGPREDVLRAIITGMESTSSYSGINTTAVSRLLQAVGTLMWGDSTVIGLAKSRDMDSILRRLKDGFSENEVKMLCNDLSVMLSSAA